MSSETPPEKTHLGTTPGVTLYYLAHVSTFEALPLGQWSDAGAFLDYIAGFLHNFDEERPEASLEHFNTNLFIDQITVSLSQLASQNGGSVQQNSPFGTPLYAQYSLPAGPWPDVLRGGETWDIQTDGVHILASLQLPQVGPSELRGSPFPYELYDQLKARLPQWELEFEQLIFGLNWHPNPASQFPLAGQVFRIQDSPLIANRSPVAGTTLHTYVGQECGKYLPLYFGDYLALSVRTKRLTTMLDVAMRVRVESDGLSLPEQLGTAQSRQEKRTELTQKWNNLVELKRQFDDQDDLMSTGRAWITALNALKKHGFYRKSTGEYILHGPYSAVMFHTGEGYELKTKEVPRLSEATLSTRKLERTLRNAERYRQRLNEDFTLVKEALDVQSSLLSLEASEQSLETANKTLCASVIGLIIALLAISITVWLAYRPETSPISWPSAGNVACLQNWVGDLLSHPSTPSYAQQS